jgi:hypothetical protein
MNKKIIYIKTYYELRFSTPKFFYIKYKRKKCDFCCVSFRCRATKSFFYDYVVSPVGFF